MNFSAVKWKNISVMLVYITRKQKFPGPMWKKFESISRALCIVKIPGLCDEKSTAKMKTNKRKMKDSASIYCTIFFIISSKLKNVIDKDLLLCYALLINQRRLTKWKILNHRQNCPRTMFIIVSVIFCTHKADIPILLDARWQWEQDTSHDKQGYTKEDCLIYVLELLDSNGQEDITD